MKDQIFIYQYSKMSLYEYKDVGSIMMSHTVSSIKYRKLM